MTDEPITQVLNRALSGDRAAHEQMYRLLYTELLKLARKHLAGAALTLNPSALVHEAYLRMLTRESAPVRDRRAFYAYAPPYSRLGDLTPVIFVTTGGVQASHSAGKTASTPFFFTKTTTNFAGFVVLALRPIVCTSPGPS
jgi:hypothetical protein